jgi:hypothetical protein
LSIALVGFSLSLGATAAQAADCEGWWWDKIKCLEKRVAVLEQQQVNLQAQLAEMPKTFGAQIAALEARLGKRIDQENKDVNGLIVKSLQRGVKLRNSKLDTCLFSDHLGVGGFRKCMNDDSEVWLLQ